MKTCRLCVDIKHRAKDCPKARRQPNFYQSGAQSQGKLQGQPGSPPSSQSNTKMELLILLRKNSGTRRTHITQEELMDTQSSNASDITQEELMDTQSSNASARNEINIKEPDPDVPKSRMDDVFGGSASTDPEDDAESISSIEEYKDVISEAEASKVWVDAKEEAEIKAGIKSCCSRCGTDIHTEGQCTASSSRNATKRKITGGEDSKPGKVSNWKRENFKRFRNDLHQVVVEGKKTDDLKYVMETDDNSYLFACYLVSVFGDYAQGHQCNDQHMTGNKEVMDLWAKLSSEGMKSVAAEEQLKTAYGHV